VRCRYVSLGKLGIHLDHVEAAVSERLLESELTAAIAEELDGERVPQGVRANADPTNPCRAASLAHQLTESVRGQGTA
jgi:hypothetical protein